MPFRAGLGMRMISSNMPVMAVRNSSMLTNRSWRVGFARAFRFFDAFGEHAEGGVDFAAFALFGDDAENFDYVFDGFKMVAAIAEDVDDADDAPALQFAEAGADVGAGDGQGGGDFVGGQRARGNEQQRVELRDGAVESPAGAHFAPVQDEFLRDRSLAGRLENVDRSLRLQGKTFNFAHVSIFGRFCKYRKFWRSWRMKTEDSAERCGQWPNSASWR